MTEQRDYEFYVGSGVRLEGATISIEGTARIDGEMEGQIRAGHLVVGSGGHLRGSIETGTADIEGRVEQTFVASGKLHVKSTGFIQGSVTYGELQCDAGGRLVGEFLTTSHEEKPARMAANPLLRAKPELASARWDGLESTDSSGDLGTPT